EHRRDHCLQVAPAAIPARPVAVKVTLPVAEPIALPVRELPVQAASPIARRRQHQDQYECQYLVHRDLLSFASVTGYNGVGASSGTPLPYGLVARLCGALFSRKVCDLLD